MKLVNVYSSGNRGFHMINTENWSTRWKQKTAVCKVNMCYNKVYNLLCRLQPPSVVDYKTTKTQIAQFTFTIKLLTEAPSFCWNSLLLPPGKYGCNSQCCLSHRQII